MIQQNSPCDPAIHQVCTEIARRCVGIIETLLRQEEKHEALREFYMAARDVIDKPSGREEEL